MSDFINALNYKKSQLAKNKMTGKRWRRRRRWRPTPYKMPLLLPQPWAKQNLRLHLHRPKDDQDDEKNYWKYFVNLFQFLVVIRPGCPNRIICHIFYSNVVASQTDDICTFSIWKTGAKQTDDIDKSVVEQVLGGEKEWSWISLLINSFLETAPDGPL